MCYCSIFQQLFNFIPRHRFEKSVKNLSGNRYCKHFSAWRQFLTCLYAQITGKDSLREIASGLMTNQRRLYHFGMTAAAKSTLADAMNRRSPEIFEALFEEILERAQEAAELNRRLTDLAARLKDRPETTIEYFVPDERKAGGAYVSVTGMVRNISISERLLVMDDGTAIPLDDIFGLQMDQDGRK